MQDFWKENAEISQKCYNTSHESPEMPMYKGFEACEVLLKHLTNPSHDTSHSGSSVKADKCRIMLPVCEVYVRGYVRGLKWTFPLFKGVSED